MPKKGENITKRKDGRYEARYVRERDEFGRIKRYGFVYAKSYFEVKKKRDEKLKKIHLEINNKNSHQDISFTNSITRWLESKLSIKDSSYTNYYSIIKSKIIPFFTFKHPHEINNDDITNFIKYLKNKELSDKRIKDILILLKQ